MFFSLVKLDSYFSDDALRLKSFNILVRSVMSNSKSFNEALDALYKAARASANFVEAALTSKNTNFDSAYKERLKVALSVLEITWSSEDDEDEDDEDEEEDDEPLHMPSNN
jgi:hypothetical protein